LNCDELKATNRGLAGFEGRGNAFCGLSIEITHQPTVVLTGFKDQLATLNEQADWF
jgi:hypothetical protein